MKLRYGTIILPALLALAGCSDGTDDAGNVLDESSDSAVQAADGSSFDGTPIEEISAPAPINVGERTLSSPSDYQMAVLFYQVVGLEPPFRDWANADRRVRNVNEFDREDVMARVQQELVLAAQAVSGIGFVEISTRSDFGEYDMTAQGFRLETFDPDRFWRWDYQNNRYKLTMENASQAELWQMPREEARSLIEGMRYRRVDLKILIKIVGAVPEPNGGGTLAGQIVKYEVFNDNGVKLGEMSYE